MVRETKEGTAKTARRDRPQALSADERAHVEKLVAAILPAEMPEARKRERMAQVVADMAQLGGKEFRNSVNDLMALDTSAVQDVAKGSGITDLTQADKFKIIVGLWHRTNSQDAAKLQMLYSYASKLPGFVILAKSPQEHYAEWVKKIRFAIEAEAKKEETKAKLAGYGSSGVPGTGKDGSFLVQPLKSSDSSSKYKELATERRFAGFTRDGHALFEDGGGTGYSRSYNRGADADPSLTDLVYRPKDGEKPKVQNLLYRSDDKAVAGKFVREEKDGVIVSKDASGGEMRTLGNGANKAGDEIVDKPKINPNMINNGVNYTKPGEDKPKATNASFSEPAAEAAKATEDAKPKGGEVKKLPPKSAPQIS